MTSTPSAQALAIAAAQQFEKWLERHEICSLPTDAFNELCDTINRALASATEELRR